MRPLVVALKKWAKNNNINEASLQTLSSYTLCLMVIHYLQCGVSPPVLPCLQKSHPRIFNPESDIFSLPYSLPSPTYTSNNTESLGELFVGFFKYFTNPARLVYLSTNSSNHQSYSSLSRHISSSSYI